MVRQAVVEHRMLAVRPLAIHDVAVFERVQQPRLVRGGPLLEQVELPFAAAARQVVAARLQQQVGRAAERQAGVGAVELFLDDDVAAGQRGQRRLVGGAVAGLQPRAFEMRRARVLQDGMDIVVMHDSSPAALLARTGLGPGKGRRTMRARVRSQPRLEPGGNSVARKRRRVSGSARSLMAGWGTQAVPQPMQAQTAPDRAACGSRRRLADDESAGHVWLQGKHA